MGQKTNPIGFRLGINKTWDSNWFDERRFADKLEEDLLLRKYLEKRLQDGAVSRIEIERTLKRSPSIFTQHAPVLSLAGRAQMLKN